MTHQKKHRFLYFITTSTLILPTSLASLANDPEDHRYPYAITLVPGIDGGRASAEGLNEHGHVVGGSRGPNHPFLWDGEKTIDLGTFGGEQGRAYDINNHGAVVGSTEDQNGTNQPFLFKNGVLTNIGQGILEAGSGKAINDAGQIAVGGLYPGDSYLTPILFSGGKLIDLPALGDNGAQVRDINEHGTIVGQSLSETGYHGAAWVNGHVVQLDDFDTNGSTPRSIALGVNDLNIAVGQSKNWTDFRTSIWKASPAIHSLPEKGNVKGYFPWARAINSSNQIVGTYIGYDDEYHGYIHTAEYGSRDLERLIPPHSRWRIEDPRDINNRGQITGWGFRTDDPDEWTQSFLLTPVDPEMQLIPPDGPLRAGELYTFNITNATPFANIKFYYGKKGGGTFITDCDAIDAILQIDDPIFFGNVLADENGNAGIRYFIHPKARSLPGVLLQAVDTDNCRESQLVLKKIN